MRDLGQPPHFPGVSNNFKYQQLVPRLDTFYVGRIQFATLASIHRLKRQLIAEANPTKPRRGRPRKVALQAEPASP